MTVGRRHSSSKDFETNLMYRFSHETLVTLIVDAFIDLVHRIQTATWFSLDQIADVVLHVDMSLCSL